MLILSILTGFVAGIASVLLKNSVYFIKEIVEKYIADHPELNITLINQLNGGVSKARNTGLKQASGNFIALLDSDDAWKQKKIEEQVNVFKTCQHVDFLGTGFAGFGINAEDGRLQRIFFKDLLFRNYLI